jgi:hypothetical protein
MSVSWERNQGSLKGHALMSAGMAYLNPLLQGIASRPLNSNV